MAEKQSQSLELFPAPSHGDGLNGKQSPLPRFWPGITPGSTSLLQRLLLENHQRYHIFFNKEGFHNHTAHSALALWVMGADETILQAAYDQSSAYQRPMPEIPSVISTDNWKEHLGEDPYYPAYLKFFKSELKEKGTDAVLQEYVFSKSANIDHGHSGDDDQSQPAMLNRFVGGLLHPAIHFGYGVEFSLPGLIVEGLAQTAVHEAQGVKFTSLFLEKADLDGQRHKNGLHAFSILQHVLEDPRLVNINAGLFSLFGDVTKAQGKAIKEYVDQWNLSGSTESKVEELAWVNVLLYAVGGSSTMENKGNFNADFFSMHLVTSSLFLSSIVTHLSAESRDIYLKLYFAVSLVWFIGRGRPAIDISKFYERATEFPVPPGPSPTPSNDSLVAPNSHRAIAPNPWLGIIQSTLVHPDEHYPKLQRALAHYAEIYGGRKAGSFAETELKGAEKLDGTVFIRAAGLTAGRLGWVREGEKALKGPWDRSGFYGEDHPLYLAFERMNIDAIIPESMRASH